MSRLQPSPRELVLLLVLLAISLGLAWYFLLFTPLYDSMLVLEEQVVAAQQQLTELQGYQRRDAQTKEQLRQLQQRQAELQAQFDPISHDWDVIVYFAELVSEGGRVLSLDIQSKQATVSISSPSYQWTRELLRQLEQSPSFVPTSLSISPGSGGSNQLRLQVSITRGQGAAGDAVSNPRETPFER
ncbi:MAG: hypothetical protein ACOX2K_01610 [Bacillota bacterium]